MRQFQALKKSKRYGLVALLVLMALFLAYPSPDQGFLFRNIPELEGKTPGLIGASTAFFLDPSLFYQFSMDESAFMQLVKQLELRELDQDSYAYYHNTILALNRPAVWHNWWWRPTVRNGKIFVGERRGNILTFIFVSSRQQVFLYIQNT